MMKRDFQNLEVFPDALTEDELDIISMTFVKIMKAINWKKQSPKKGSFALYGQKKGHGAKVIMSFNLCEGASSVKDALIPDTNSAAQVTSTIDGLLKWPHCQRVCHEEPREELFGELPTGIYSYKATKAAVINTTLGRFIVAFHNEFPDVRYDTEVLLGVAQCLALMNPNDVVMQQSFGKLNILLDSEILEMAKKLFQTRLPEVTVWHLHHDDIARKLYFSEN